jgi:hypothetical protein
MDLFPYPPVLPVKLKGKDVKSTRASLLEKQGYKCTLCGRDCTDDQAVLDHDHKGGHIRSVLHRGCNAAEGKIMNSMRRYGIPNPIEFLENMIKYQKTHATNQTNLIHPTFLTPEEKKEKLAKKRKKVQLAKKQDAKARKSIT